MLRRPTELRPVPGPTTALGQHLRGIDSLSLSLGVRSMSNGYLSSSRLTLLGERGRRKRADGRFLCLAFGWPIAPAPDSIQTPHPLGSNPLLVDSYGQPLTLSIIHPSIGCRLSYPVFAPVPIHSGWSLLSNPVPCGKKNTTLIGPHSISSAMARPSGRNRSSSSPTSRIYSSIAPPVSPTFKIKPNIFVRQWNRNPQQKSSPYRL